MHNHAVVQVPPMVRYGFSIRTKTGQRVDNIQIVAATPEDAERRLRQMYLHCDIIDRREQSVPSRAEAAGLPHLGTRARILSLRAKAGAH